MTEPIGFIGLGAMGDGMARNILKAGFSLMIVSRSPAKAEAYRDLGAAVATSAADLAEHCRIVVTCLPDDTALRTVATGETGLAASHWRGGLLIDCSTISPLSARDTASLLADRGAAFVDAPVSGGVKGAKEGTLTIMCGGGADDIAKALPVLRAMGSAILQLGPVGAGQAVKACNQLMVAVNMMGAFEAIAIARASGVDPQRMCEALSTGAARSAVLEAHARRYLDGALGGGFRAELMRKDLGIVCDIGGRMSLFQPAANLAQQLITTTCNLGNGKLDSAALGLLYDGLNGAPPRNNQ